MQYQQFVLMVGLITSLSKINIGIIHSGELITTYISTGHLARIYKSCVGLFYLQKLELPLLPTRILTSVYQAEARPTVTLPITCDVTCGRGRNVRGMVINGVRSGHRNRYSIRYTVNYPTYWRIIVSLSTKTSILHGFTSSMHSCQEVSMNTFRKLF